LPCLRGLPEMATACMEPPMVGARSLYHQVLLVLLGSGLKRGLEASFGSEL
jgi:hypothetical protein